MFAVTYSEAERLAEQGQLPRAYLVLRAGVVAAKENRNSWAPELLDLWFCGLERFRREYPLSLESYGISAPARR